MTDGASLVEALAVREDKSERSIRMTLSLAFISPVLAKAAMEGRLPRGFSVNRLDAAKVAAIEATLRTRYADFGATLASEKLRETALELRSPAPRWRPLVERRMIARTAHDNRLQGPSRTNRGLNLLGGYAFTGAPRANAECRSH